MEKVLLISNPAIQPNYHQKGKFDEIFITAKNFLKVYTLDGCSVLMVHVFTTSITTENFAAGSNN